MIDIINYNYLMQSVQTYENFTVNSTLLYIHEIGFTRQIVSKVMTSNLISKIVT